MKNRLKKLFFDDHENISMTDDYIRYKVMFYFVITPGILFLFILSSFAFYEKEMLLAILDSALLLIMTTLFILARLNIFLRKVIISFVSITILFFLIFFTLGLGRNQSFLWYYCIPVVSIFYFGIKGGLTLSLLVAFISVLIAVFGNYIPHYSPYPDGFLFRFFFSYLCVTVFVCIHESSRQQTKAELETTMEKLRQETLVDSLTQLYNRRYMDSIFDFYYRQSDRECSAAFIMADLDYFKQYNDTYGHQAGDIVIQEFAEVLRNNIRRSTDYAFRYGGEEFSLLLTCTNRDIAEEISSRIIEDFERLNIPHKKSPYSRVTVSAGTAFIKKIRTVSKQDLIRIADETLYESKKSGRNCYKIEIIDPDLPQ